ncbi:hypothetical protein ACF0H5_006985 [Mactra antiquata]
MAEHLRSCQFVGRLHDFQTLDKYWSGNRLFGIYGIRAVGKSRFVEEYLKTKECGVTNVDLVGTQQTNSAYTILCAALHIEPSNDADDGQIWIAPLLEHLNDCSEEKPTVIVFDNAEDIIEGPTKDSFMSMISEVVKNCEKVKIFITSTTRVLFTQLGKVYTSQKLEPLSQADTEELLKFAAPNVDFGPYRNVIIELSEGLPLLILMIGSELTAVSRQISVREMVNLLLNCRLEALSHVQYSDEYRVGFVYKNFIKRLADIYQEHLSTLDYIPGSFNAMEAEGMLEVGSVALTKHNALRPILSRHVLNYDSNVQRFNIQGILREIIKSEFVVKNLPEVRRRYCKTFTAVMKEICRIMGTSEYTKAMSEFAMEQPNLCKLMKEVNHTKEDTYHFFIEVASSCTELIEVYMANDGQQFYNSCLSLAEQYGRQEDKAIVYMAVGSMETLTKVRYSTLYQKLGWNIFKQGECEEAIKLYKKSFDISNKYTDDISNILTLQTMGYIGVVYVVLGNFDEAEKYHFPTLRMCEEKHGKIHPKTGNAYNRIGLLFDQRGNALKGLEYFQEGLEIKRKAKAPPISIVYSLSNVANSLKVLDRFDEAHAVVDEAFEILERQDIYMLDGYSLMFNTRGKIYARQGKWTEASTAFNKTVEITRLVEQSSYIYMKRLVNLAEMLEKCHRFKSCLEVASEAIALKSETTKALPHNFIAIECYQCMARVHNFLGHTADYVNALLEIDKECLRLEKVCTAQYNEMELERIDQIREELDEQFNELKM